MGLLPDRSDDSGTGRIGPFSTYAEVHAFVIGVAVGFVVTCIDNWLDTKYKLQVKQELPYTIAGIVVGTVVYGIESMYNNT